MGLKVRGRKKGEGDVYIVCRVCGFKGTREEEGRREMWTCCGACCGRGVCVWNVLYQVS